MGVCTSQNKNDNETIENAIKNKGEDAIILTFSERQTADTASVIPKRQKTYT